MRKVLMIGIAGFVTACAAQPDVPPIVSWSYGAGNGDGVQYPGPKPNFSFASEVGADVPVSGGPAPKVQYGYGAENEAGKGMMVQMQPSAPPNQRVASPATNPSQIPAPGQTPAPGSHS